MKLLFFIFYFIFLNFFNFFTILPTNNETDFLTVVLHRIYGKFMSLRNVVKSQTGYIFCQVSKPTKRNNLTILLFPQKQKNKKKIVIVLTMKKNKK